jgi:phage replication O-like protein O
MGFNFIRMASPQVENGYTKIANEILDRLVNTSLLGAEFQVLLFIIRKTYGYNKIVDRISFTQFEKATGISRPTINKTIKNLITKGMIVKIYLPEGNIGYTFIKDHEKWVVKTHLLVKGKWQTGKDVLTKTGKDVLTHKRKKENKRKNTEQAPFSLFEELEKYKKDKRRHIQLIAEYLDEKKIPISSREELEIAIKRHCKDAVELASFDDKRIGWATSVAEKEYPNYTLKTLTKILTR